LQEKKEIDKRKKVYVDLGSLQLLRLLCFDVTPLKLAEVFSHRRAANRPCIPINGGQNGTKSSSLRTPDILLYGDAFYLSLVRMCAIGICRVADMGTMAPPSESIL
jgi:hypothetical protein